MLKFAIECPECGKVTEGKTGLFEKKEIQCSCGNNIFIYVGQLAKTESVSSILNRSFKLLENGKFEDAAQNADIVLDKEPSNAQAYLIKLMAECHAKNTIDLGSPYGYQIIKNENYRQILRLGSPNERREIALIAARQYIPTSDDIDRLSYAKTQLLEVFDSDDISTVLDEIENKIERLKKEKEDAQKKLQQAHSIEFGRYYNKDGKTKEPIEWLVLETEGSKTLLISRYIIDRGFYFNGEGKCNWEESDVRKWLSNDFMDAAFSCDEKMHIQTVSHEYIINRRAVCQDKVFLLSAVEAEKYLSTSALRKCEVTPYVFSSFDNHDKDYYKNANDSSSWWLRSSSDLEHPDYFADYVEDDGVIRDDTFDCKLGIRPAMWIDMS